MKECVLWLKRGLPLLISAILLIQISGCGTLLYPERRGQTTGRIDVGIAILDGVGLLFFVIPGLIAYGVDFTTGAIYLPGGHSSSPSGNGIKVVWVNPAELDQRKIDGIVARVAGIPEGALAGERAEICAVSSPEEICLKLAGFKM